MTLAKTLYDMDFTLEYDSIKSAYKIFDEQTGEYVPTYAVLRERKNKSLYTEEDYLYKDATEIIERLEVFINDYWFRELHEYLEEKGFCCGNWSEMVFQVSDKLNELPNHIKSYFDILKCFCNPNKFDSVIDAEEKKHEA